MSFNLLTFNWTSLMICFVINFQAFGIGYLKLNPDGQVKVHSEDPKPILRVRPDAHSRFRRYGFVDAVLGLDPVGRLNLQQSDYKVLILGFFNNVPFLESLDFFDKTC